MLPPADLLIPFLVAGLALNLTPGPDMTFVAAVAGRAGWRCGFVASLGIAAGCVVHVTLAVTGISGVLAASESMFAILRLAGAGYLVYVAIGILRGAAPNGEEVRPASPSWAGVFRKGLMVNVLNPKVGLFFLAFLPQFVDSSRGTGLQLLFLGLLFNLSGTLVNLLVSVAVAGSARPLAHLPMATRGIRWLAGAALLFFAFRMAHSRA